MAKRPKLTRMQKLDRDIMLAHRKQEHALKLGEKSKRMLLASARELARAQAAKRRLESKLADELVTAQAKAEATVKQAAPMGMVNDGEPVEPITPLPEAEAVADFVERGRAAQAKVDEILAKVPDLAKPKRQRKPKTAPGSERAALHHTPPQAKAESREARMKALGFRKTGKRSNMPA